MSSSTSQTESGDVRLVIIASRPQASAKAYRTVAATASV